MQSFPKSCNRLVQSALFLTDQPEVEVCFWEIGRLLRDCGKEISCLVQVPRTHCFRSLLKLLVNCCSLSNESDATEKKRRKQYYGLQPFAKFVWLGKAETASKYAHGCINFIPTVAQTRQPWRHTNLRSAGH